MNYHIELLTKNKEQEYAEYIDHSPQATIYHTLAWRDISSSVFGHKPFFLIAEHNGTIYGALPLFLVESVLGRRLVSVPLRDKGGPLYDNDEVLAQLLEAAHNLMFDLRCKYLHMKVWHGLDFQHSRPKWIYEHNHFINSSLPLEKDFESLWKAFDKRSVRRPIQKSRREGVTCYWGSTLDEMRAFYNLFLLTRKKLGVPPYGFDLFYAIWDTMIQKGTAGLILAQYRGLVISGLIVFFSHNTVWGGYAASHKEYLHLRPNNLLLSTVIQEACTHGFKLFDFGADSPDNPGLLSFKAGFGTVTEVLPHYYMFAKGKKSFSIDFDSKKYKIHRRLFGMLPICISKNIGPLIVRQLG